MSTADLVSGEPVVPARRRWWQRRWLWVVTGLVVVIIGFVLFWFQPQKLFIDERVDESAPAGIAVDVARGEFVSREHSTSGVVRVLELEDGSRVIRLESLDTSNGPVLRVYLSANPADGEESEFDEVFVDLGGLKGNIGSQNYEIPADTDLAELTTVVIWCDRFDVPFGAADLTLEA